MQDEPKPSELTTAVAHFLRNDIVPLVAGHNAFKLRVAINALDLVTRQLTLAQESDAAESARLAQLLGREGSLLELNQALAQRIASGEVDLADARSRRTSLADHHGQARGRSAELRVVQEGVGPQARLAPLSPSSFRDGPKDQTRNLEILRCARAHHSSTLRIAPE